MTTSRVPADFRKFTHDLDDVSLARVQYCFQLGSTFVHLSRMEDTTIRAMAICDRIRVATVLGSDAERWKEFLEKTKRLEESTLGNLLKILSKHNIEETDIIYLKWVKERRDFFVHRFFRRGEWPGELRRQDCEVMIRKLLYLELIFSRAGYRIWRILARANLMEMEDLGSDGALMFNVGTFDDLGGPT